MTSPENLHKFDTLVEIIARLRAPDGCPWDKEQTHQTLRENLLSETYEVLETLDEADAAKLCEELGDLLLQIVLHAQIAKDTGEFEIGDVISSISSKIVRRHPHIFGSKKVKDAEEVMHNWEALKEEEREEGVSMLEGVPEEMPALAYAYEISRRAVRVGFEWENIEGVIDKLIEEIREIKEAGSREEKEQEFGDLLFTMVNFARWQGIDAEVALREANRKFYRRFSKVEELCRQRGKELQKLSLKEWDELWEEAKKHIDI
ncbi:MAG: nucleoside triphosphate pyrophosphohydrolase [Chloroflexi bacterium RBG_13_51_52]|nr:MAG: nucleoside triphosphate pyrophosphohydrolase [Chloroflexi bacterium RBG_13_51_52]